jgi:hypothetical protein
VDCCDASVRLGRSRCALVVAFAAWIEGSAAAEPAEARHPANAVRLEANLGSTFDPEMKWLPSISGLAGVELGPLQAAAALEWHTLLTQNLNFVGAGVGPILKFPDGLRVEFLAMTGASIYSNIGCGFGCRGGADYTAFTLQGRTSVGWVFSRKRGARGLLTAWASAGYTPVETIAYTTTETPWISVFGEPEPTVEHRSMDLGGFRGSAGLGLALLLPI